MAAKLQMDTSAGTSDLAWNLVMLFFITTFIAIRPTSGLVAEVLADKGNDGNPVVVAWPDDAVPALAGDPLDLAHLQVRDVGPIAAPADGQSINDWLKAICGGDAPPVVLVQCPGDATHTQCQRLLKALMRQATCPYQY